MCAVGLMILAAGGSTRLGRPKQLLPFRGRSLLRHAVETGLASACRPICVVLGAHAGHLREELAGLPVQTVINPDWETGLGSSIRAGMRAFGNSADGGPSDGVIVALCDQPLISTAHYDALVDAARQGDARVVASRYGGAVGVPALFRKPLFAALETLPDDQGAKHLIRQQGGRVVTVEAPGAEWDVDTAEDYERLLSSAPRIQQNLA